LTVFAIQGNNEKIAQNLERGARMKSTKLTGFIAIPLLLAFILGLTSCGESLDESPQTAPLKQVKQRFMDNDRNRQVEHSVGQPVSTDLRVVKRAVFRTAPPRAERPAYQDFTADPNPMSDWTRERYDGSVLLDIEDTVLFQEGLHPDASYTQPGTTIWAYYPDDNYCTDTIYGFGRNGAFFWPYLKFDISAAIPADSQVLQAVLSMYLEDGYGAYQNAGSHKVLSAWDECSLTYNNKPADWNNEIYESIIYMDGLGWFDWDITQMTSDWVASPAQNYGLAVIPTDSLADGDRLYFASDDYGSVSLRPILTVDYLLPEHRSIYVSQTPPASQMHTGEQAQVLVRFRNEGADTWTTADGYKLGSHGPQDNTNWGFNRVALPHSVAMDNEVEFTFQVTAPATTGTYTFQWQVLQEGVTWFGDLSNPVDVLVVKKAPGDPCVDGSECDSGICADDVCCDSNLCQTDDCVSCDQAGFEGNCRYIAAGTDPDNECAGTAPCGSYCNGSGACEYPSAGTACADCASCDGGGNCSQYEAAGSDPGGVCGICRVCPGNSGDCTDVAAGNDPQEECTPAAPESCGFTGDCDGQGACAFHPQATECSAQYCQADVYYPADFCDGAGVCSDATAQACLPYVCLDAVSCRTDCTLDEHCIAGSHCENDICVAYLQRGEACSRDEECINGNCVDGVCCDSQCDGICEVCNLPVDPGGCLAVPDGEDPRDACLGSGLCGGVCAGDRTCRFTATDVNCAPCTSCDGAGSCALYAAIDTDPYNDCNPCWSCSGLDESCRLVDSGDDPLDDCAVSAEETCGTNGVCDGSGACLNWPAGIICVPSICTNGLLEPADLCDGAGACINTAEIDCSGYVCLSAEACRTDCSVDDDCLMGFHCEDTACVADRQTGMPCSREGECASGNCADGVCCSSACQANCERCDLADSVGTCAFVPAGQDPDSECGDGGICSGACDGSGVCILPGQETACGSCARCDGAGTCSVMVEGGTDPDDACGVCRVCAGDRDECILVSAGDDPLEECELQPQNNCALDGVCDGRGACRLWQAGTSCGSQSCAGDVLTRAPTCDGLGNCQQQGTVSCAPYICDGDQCSGPAGLHHVSVEDAASGAGQSVTDLALTTDDTLELFAIGRDAAGDYLDDVVVSWSVSGEIGTIQPGPSRSAIFDPTTPGNGQVTADFYRADVVDGVSGLLAVGPGLAAGNVELVADPEIIPANGFSSSVVTAGPVTDADGNQVSNGTYLTVITSAGSLLGDDDDPGQPGFQRATTSGFFTFVVVSGTEPATVLIRVLAVPPGTAQGEGTIFFGDDKPVANAGPDQAVNSLAQVTLDGSASFDPYQRPISYAWNQTAGDSVSLNAGNSATPSFEAPQITGQQTLTFELVVNAGSDQSAPDVVDVVVTGQEAGLPVAKIVLTPEQGPAPLEVLADGRDSTAAEGANLVEFLWTFADGAAAVNSQSTTRTYSEPGGYGISLTVTDSEGRFDTARAQVSVGDGTNLPPQLYVTAVPERGDSPLEVVYTAQASDPDGSIDRIEWDFGGGFTLSGSEQTRLYTRAGRHSILVRAVDNLELATTIEVDVFVSQNGIYPPQIISSPETSASVGLAYEYHPIAIGTQPFTWTLGKDVGGEIQRAPAGMQADQASGWLSWVPANDQADQNDVTLVVSNEAGSDFQDFSILVEGGGTADGCSCSAQPVSRTSGFLLGLLLLGWLRTRKNSKPGGS